MKEISYLETLGAKAEFKIMPDDKSAKFGAKEYPFTEKRQLDLGEAVIFGEGNEYVGVLRTKTGETIYTGEVSSSPEIVVLYLETKHRRPAAI